MPLPGHYASVIKLDERTGIALSTDGVGTKLLVAEQLGRFDTVGIDCVAMNVNDVICVGAEPLAMLDYIAVEKAEPEVCEQIGVGLAPRGRAGRDRDPRRRAGPARRAGHAASTSAGACFGTVALDAIIDGSAVEPGDVGDRPALLRASTPTATRSPARALAGIPLDDDRLGRPLGEVLLEPTEIYVQAGARAAALRRSRSAASPTSPPAASATCCASRPRSATRSTTRCPVPPIFELIQERGDVSDEEMHEVFNMGCGFCVVVAAADEEAALELLRGHYPEARRIGRAIEGRGASRADRRAAFAAAEHSSQRVRAS